ncbi:hypothetical protein T4B_12075 [Trichinella pseudospiralis]|uniref:Uncharacterized protein n=1 Tax=Trichinella pseudospiralis TaxID=6337 RepID=A0A0V1I3C0_TRIPS|nr:hypothetical protein T4E_1568 [Trichinella pseudospiralis]KRY66658.1 hypothetical protein T4A_1237 [Trichinella pseudospiralis]KRZ17467.1 hypothetical protein T4B_12075 [Trichinella pseudospiralis]
MDEWTGGKSESLNSRKRLVTSMKKYLSENAVKSATEMRRYRLLSSRNERLFKYLTKPTRYMPSLIS